MTLLKFPIWTLHQRNMTLNVSFLSTKETSDACFKKKKNLLLGDDHCQVINYEIARRKLRLILWFYLQHILSYGVLSLFNGLRYTILIYHVTIY